MGLVSDAASWVDEWQALLFPLATRIIDCWHVTEYLWAVANAWSQEGSVQARAWAEVQVQTLRAGPVAGIQAALARLKPTTKAQRAVVATARTYLANHHQAMDYPRYEPLGYHIGSGIAEAACKHVMPSRFQRSGMRWSRAGAENLLRLRLADVHHQWDEWLNAMRNEPPEVGCTRGT
jgi:hypothetical protein